MNFTESLAKLESSREFEKLKNENPASYLCAGFFVLDFDSRHDTQQIDFQAGEKIATFSVGDGISIKMEETVDNKKVPAIKPEIKIDIDEMQKIAGREIEKNKIAGKLNKIIAILQMRDNRQIWNVTCVFASLVMLRMHIDSFSGDVLKSEKSSMFDFVQKLK